jgi:hypothetical protein
MVTYKRLACVAVPILAALACGTGGTVARFAPCGPTDTCPEATVCEPVAVTSMGVTAGATFCTWSCNNDDFGGQSCPSDPNGVQGICVTSINNTSIGQEYDYGFCFQDCSSGGACPEGESCESAQAYSGGSGSTMVCVPTPTDLLSGTSWQSSTVTPMAQAGGVSTSTYTINFGTATAFTVGAAAGPFSATFMQTYSASASSYAGCTETTAFTGGQWVDVTGPMMTGAVAVSGVSGLTNRTSCASSSDDVADVSGVYDDEVNGQSGAIYTITGTTMSLTGDSGYGVTPYSDANSSWAFTKM